MAERRIEHTYNCPEGDFWKKIFLDQEFNRQLYMQHFGFSSWELIEQRAEGDNFRRVVRAQPPVPDLPGPLRKLAENGVGYTERGLYSPAENSYRLTVEPQSLASKLDISGHLFTEALSDQQCRRVYVGHVTAKVFGVGRLLEARILDDIEKSYRKSAEYTNRWLETH